MTIAELADPDRVIAACIEIYGSEAATAAAACALEAHFAGRGPDYWFSCQAYRELMATGTRPEHEPLEMET
ncbi:hypothetical protein FKO01_51925 [Mesorhizobium sp. B2-3-3]|nr:hypothetical protein FKO01_51925 [Mesorhizobium sp. B2-3-3]